MTNLDMDPETATIRALNDSFRTTFTGGKSMLTDGVRALPLEPLQQLLRAVKTFSDFGPDNDPHHEHDFGSVELFGDKFFWKIDYYDKNMEAGSEDPSDPAQTTRLLTIMLASEY